MKSILRFMQDEILNSLVGFHCHFPPLFLTLTEYPFRENFSPALPETAASNDGFEFSLHSRLLLYKNNPLPLDLKQNTQSTSNPEFRRQAKNSDSQS